MQTPPPGPVQAQTTAREAGTAGLRDAAERMEAAFLSEMLGAAGLGAPRDGWGGGAGEAQFASLLRDRQAAALVDRGGLGLAESLFRALAGRADADG